MINNENSRYVTGTVAARCGALQPQSGKYRRDNHEPTPPAPQLRQPELPRAEQMIHEAETSRARIYEVAGRHDLQITPSRPNLLHNQYHSALLDKDYLLVRNYIDESM